VIQLEIRSMERGISRIAVLSLIFTPRALRS